MIHGVRTFHVKQYRMKVWMPWLDALHRAVIVMIRLTAYLKLAILISVLIALYVPHNQAYERWRIFVLSPGYARNKNKDSAPLSARERSSVSISGKNRGLTTVYLIINERRGKCDVHTRKWQRGTATQIKNQNFWNFGESSLLPWIIVHLSSHKVFIILAVYRVHLLDKSISFSRTYRLPIKTD